VAEKFALTLDSSQISTFLECPELWNNKYNKLLEPLYFKENEAMSRGTYGHKLLDIYYRMRSRHLSQNDAFDKMLDYDPDNDTCECGCSKDFHCPVGDIVECRKCKKCMAFRPIPFVLNKKDRDKVIKRLRDYYKEWYENDIVPQSEYDVEVGFTKKIYEDDDNIFSLEGRIDVIGRYQGIDVIMDHKFQGQTYWLYQKSIQFKNYCLVTNCTTAIINYIRLTDKIEKNITLNRTPVSFNRLELQAWYKRLIDIFFRVKKMKQAGTYDHNWNSCTGWGLTYKLDEPKYCVYTPLCEEIHKEQAEIKEKELYKIKSKAWVPWE